MKFAVGYQLAEQGDESFVELVRDYRECISEVYFPWGALASGRASLTSRRGCVDWSGQQRMERDLLALKEMGLRLDLLFNANCYGQHAVSEYLQNQVMSLVEYLKDLLGGVQTVTTTSLAVAHVLKKHAPDVEVRASVNMRLGTPTAMSAIAHLFDGYYVQRDFNRDIGYLRELRRWADLAGKKLYLLANSGCLRFCPAQTFHDNMVAHDAQIDEMRNIAGFTPHLCWALFKDPANWVRILQATWIRPEDLHHYEGLFDVVKLATRMHSRPRMVLGAYSRRQFGGNLPDLLEPGFSPALAPNAIANTRFPADWFERTSTCAGRCHACNYCNDVLAKVLCRAE